MAKQPAMRTRRRSGVDLGESWVVEEDEDEELSSEQGSEYSTSSEEPSLTVKPSTRSKTATPGRRLAESTSMTASKQDSESATLDEEPNKMTKSPTRSQTAAQRRRSAIPPLMDNSEPTLVMPSIYEEAKELRGGSRNRRVPVQPSPKKHRSNGQAPTAKVSHAAPKESESMFHAIGNSFLPILRFIFGIIGRTFRLLEGPLAVFVAACVLYALFVFTRNFLKTSIYAAISPVCLFPGSSLLLPMCAHRPAIDYAANKEVPVHFDELMSVQDKFEDILEQTAAGIELPLDMKRSEASIRDLRSQVSYSSLNSKAELVHEFTGFIDTARIASKDLQVFNSHVGRSVDIVLSLAKWTARTLHGIEDDEAGRGALARLFNPFGVARKSEERLVTQYLEHAHAIENEIHRLVLEAQALLQVLQNLDDRLDVISSITARDTQTAQLSQAEVLAELWTMLGGNGAKLSKFEGELNILRQVNTYRQNAFGYVAGTILRLQAMESELENLRERVAGPGNGRGVPLSVHIDNIQLGLERLECGRQLHQRKEAELMMARLREVRPGEELPALPPPRKMEISL